MRLLGLVLVTWALAGCASGRADPRLDAEAKQFRPLADKACVYVVPSISSMAVTIALNGRKAATLEDTTFLRLDVLPGRHVLGVAPASLLPTFLNEAPDTVTVEAEAGRCYYLRVLWGEGQQGWREFRVYWARVTETVGQREVNIRRMVLPAR